jgi:hypothetical protein
MHSLCCPSCQAVLGTPDELPADRWVKCPECGDRVRNGTRVDRRLIEFWELANIDEALAEAGVVPHR